MPVTSFFDNDMKEKFKKIRELKGKKYKPRTRHLDTNGWAKYTNRLFLETSPYLLQHAHNPVNWYPWGDEAFAAAKKLNRPVFLSVGYSTCHWCHVMEEESFEDEEIAKYMNENYIAIKVDREERPDVDAIFMSAVQAITGRGGWPMSVWLNSDRKPFHGGTYFPARDGDRGASLGFLTLLKRLKNVYDTQPDKILEVSANLTKAIQRNLSPSGAGGLPDNKVLHNAFKAFESKFDPIYGGTSGSMKFPSSMPIRFMLRYYRRTQNKKALQIATTTLEKMAAGGMYDHVGGGFHRYSTDKRWLVPHFEKMLYDNALITLAYLEGFQVTGRKDFERITREILRYVERDMTSPEGGFYSATDADSLNPEGHREEGWFFTWTPKEIRQVLGTKDAKIVMAFYNVSSGGNFEGRNIFHTPKPMSKVAANLGISEGNLFSIIAKSKEKLYPVRKKRPAPIRDEKILTAWNGLMISAYAQAGLILGEIHYIEQGKNAANFILKNLYIDGRLFRSYKDGRARLNAYLNDYAFFIASLLDLYEATGEIKWFKKAIELDKVLQKYYEDKKSGGFFMTSNDHEKLLIRQKPSYDGAEPTGNSIAILNLLRLQEFTTNDKYRKRAAKALRSFGNILSKAPMVLSEMLLAVDFHTDLPKEIIIITPKSRSEANPFLLILKENFLPNRVFVVLTGKNLKKHEKLVPLVQSKYAMKGKATAYVCEKGICELPTTDPEVFSKQIKKLKKIN